MTALFQTVTDFIAQHPNWAGLLVFVTAAVESVAVIGAIIPGTTILVGVGAVVGLGHLPMWPILIWSTLGAIAGDGLSYWLGHRYRDQVVLVWPFSRRPQLLAQGEAFFHRYGGMSIAVGRFLPVMRAVVPVVAGVLGMSPARFYTANVLSALAWAPLHILPGAALGASLGVVGGISGRLVILILGSIILVIAGGWLLKLIVGRTLPWLVCAQVAIVAWAKARRGHLPRLILAALDPDDPTAGTVLILGIVLIACGVGFVGIAEDVVTRGDLVQADAAFSNLIQNVRTPWGDKAMVAVTRLGDTVVSGSVSLAVLGWLMLRRQWRLAVGFCIALGLAAGSVMALKAVLHVSRPIVFSSGADAFSFPSGHAAMAAVLYGILAWLVSSRLPSRWRALPLVVGGSLVGLIAASRIYLAAHWPSDVGAGVLIGFGLAAVFGLVFRRAVSKSAAPLGLAAVAVASLLIVGGWHALGGLDAGLKTYARQDAVTLVAKQEWLHDGWRQIPQRRIDLVGETEEAFVLQWAGPIEDLHDLLITANWQPPVGWAPRTAASFINGSTSANSLPVLPVLHDGRPPELTLVKSGATMDQRAVFRAWPSGFAVDSGQGSHPLVVASVVNERIARPWGMASLPRDMKTADAEQSVLLRDALIKASLTPKGIPSLAGDRPLELLLVAPAFIRPGT
ncbi:MAG: VTT domain-containing protein [Gammaproteobacteria bacterium]